MFSRKQRGVAIGMALAAAVTALVLASPPQWFGVSLEAQVHARMVTAVRAAAITMMWLLAAVANVARGRFMSPADIDGSGFAPASPQLRFSVAMVQNTLEQVVLAAVLYLALARLGRPDEAALIPQLAALFCLGRLVFWMGYRHGAPWRAFGFAVTFYPTVVGYAILALDLLRSNPV